MDISALAREEVYNSPKKRALGTPGGNVSATPNPDSTDLENPAEARVSNAREAYIRKMGWFGAKYYVKCLIGWRPVNTVLVPLWRLATFRAPGNRSRFPVNRYVVEGQVNGIKYRLLNPMRCSIAKELFWNHGKREALAEQFALELFCRLAKQANIVLDIGSNTGIFTIVAAAVNSEVEMHAYEIVPEVVLQLAGNLIENDILSRVHIHAYGLGESGTELKIPSVTRSSALPSAFSSKLHYSEGSRVRFCALNEELRFMKSGAPVLLKVDVEGTENDLFNHGHDFVAALQPDILCEILPEECKLDEVREFMRVHSYHAYKILDDQLKFLPELIPDHKFHDWLFSPASPEEFAARIAPLRIG
jgi:FkbM family methyltransferase